ncbi:MAG: OmpA family protein [Gemmatimonadales bacterium]|nr:OmpA family protein [Gemmatimonadales bacterium]
MTQRSLATSLMALVLLTTACGKKAEPATSPTPVRPPAGTNADSIARAREDSIRRAAAAAAEKARLAAAAAEAERAALINQLAETIHFEYNMDVISTEDQARLDAKAAIIRANPALRIRITGHADERGSDEYNIALGMRRAVAAKAYLIGKGIEGGRIEVASLGREVPIDPSSNEAAWARNRRDEFEVVAGGQSLVKPN